VSRRAVALGFVALLLGTAPASAVPPSQVDPFVGVDGEGNVYPGAGVPFGFARVSPDTTRPSPAGYSSAGRMLGFSQTHVSGVGGGGSMYGNLRLTPVSGRLRVSGLGSAFDQERASPGWYSVLLAPWLYIHAGRHDRTAATVRRLLATRWSPTRAGLPGNDDAGALSSWYVWSSIGLFPSAGSAAFYIGSPVFRRVRIAVGRRRSFVVEAPRAAPGRPYVASAALNGRPLARAWLTNAELTRGGRLVLTMSDRPGAFGTAAR